MRFKADSSYRVTNQHLVNTYRSLKRKNIVVTEPKKEQPLTAPICIHGKGDFNTVKKVNDSYVNESLYNTNTRSDMLQVILPVQD